LIQLVVLYAPIGKLLTLTNASTCKNIRGNATAAMATAATTIVQIGSNPSSFMVITSAKMMTYMKPAPATKQDAALHKVFSVPLGK
jgi:hypothetical protein